MPFLAVPEIIGKRTVYRAPTEAEKQAITQHGAAASRRIYSGQPGQIVVTPISETDVSLGVRPITEPGTYEVLTERTPALQKIARENQAETLAAAESGRTITGVAFSPKAYALAQERIPAVKFSPQAYALAQERITHEKGGFISTPTKEKYFRIKEDKPRGREFILTEVVPKEKKIIVTSKEKGLNNRGVATSFGIDKDIRPYTPPKLFSKDFSKEMKAIPGNIKQEASQFFPAFGMGAYSVIRHPIQTGKGVGLFTLGSLIAPRKTIGSLYSKKGISSAESGFALGQVVIIGGISKGFGGVKTRTVQGEPIVRLSPGTLQQKLGISRRTNLIISDRVGPELAEVGIKPLTYEMPARAIRSGTTKFSTIGSDIKGKITIPQTKEYSVFGIKVAQKQIKPAEVTFALDSYGIAATNRKTATIVNEQLGIVRVSSGGKSLARELSITQRGKPVGKGEFSFVTKAKGGELTGFAQEILIPGRKGRSLSIGAAFETKGIRDMFGRPGEAQALIDLPGRRFVTGSKLDMEGVTFKGKRVELVAKPLRSTVRQYQTQTMATQTLSKNIGRNLKEVRLKQISRRSRFKEFARQEFARQEISSGLSQMQFQKARLPQQKASIAGVEQASVPIIKPMASQLAKPEQPISSFKYPRFASRVREQQTRYGMAKYHEAERKAKTFPALQSKTMIGPSNLFRNLQANRNIQRNVNVQRNIQRNVQSNIQRNIQRNVQSNIQRNIQRQTQLQTQTQIQRQTQRIVTPLISLPRIPSPLITQFKFDLGLKKQRKLALPKISIKQPRGYTPTFFSAFLRVRGKPTRLGTITALGLRPIPLKGRRKRK